jgi:hypothetical protein
VTTSSSADPTAPDVVGSPSSSPPAAGRCTRTSPTTARESCSWGRTPRGRPASCGWTSAVAPCHPASRPADWRGTTRAPALSRDRPRGESAVRVCGTGQHALAQRGWMRSQALP